MANKTASDAYNKWKTAMTSQATLQRMVSGVQNTTKNPMTLATDTERSAKWRAKMQADTTFNKWKSNTAAFPQDQWKARTAAADQAKVAAAANGAQTKFQDVFTNLMAFEYALSSLLESQLTGRDLQTNVLRSSAFQFGMTAFLKNGKATMADAVAAINANMGGLVTVHT